MLTPGPAPAIPPTLAEPASRTLPSLERLSALTGITRAEIAAAASEAHGPWLLHLGPRERIAVLEALAGIYACIGYGRKEAYILREVLGCVMDLVVVGREDPVERERRASISIKSPQANGLGIQGVPMNGEAAAGSVGARENEGKEGNDGVLRIVTHVCKVHGIDLQAVTLLDFDASEEDLEDIIDDDAIVAPFGWPELQVGIVREALAVAEALPGIPNDSINYSRTNIINRLPFSGTICSIGT
jgi:hypothetical protein